MFIGYKKFSWSVVSIICWFCLSSSSVLCATTATKGGLKVTRDSDACYDAGAAAASYGTQCTSLLCASYMGDLNTVTQLLAYKKDPNEVGDDGYTPLMYAAKGGFNSIVQSLLSAGANANYISPAGITAFALAYKNQHPDTAKIIRSYITLTTQDSSNVVIKLASNLEKNSPATSSKFVKTVDQGSAYSSAFTVLWLNSKWLSTQPGKAGGMYSNEWFKNLISQIAVSSSQDQITDANIFASLLMKIQYPKMYFSDNGAYANDIAATIPLSGIDTNGKSIQKVYSIVTESDLTKLGTVISNIVHDGDLVYLTFRDNVRSVQYCAGLFKSNGNYYYYDSAVDPWEMTSSSVAEIAQLIYNTNSAYTLGKNSPIGFMIFSYDASASSYPTPSSLFPASVDCNFLLSSAQVGALDEVRYCLDQGVQVSCTDNSGSAALAYTAQSGYTAIVDMLLNAGADVNAADSAQKTALLVACEDGYLDTIQRLLQAPGINVDASAKDNLSPFTIAATYGRTPVLSLLRNTGGVMVNRQTTSKGMSPLMFAAMGGYLEATQLILDMRANVNLQNNNGRTALMFAASYGYTDVVQILLQYGAKTSIRDKGGKTALDYATAGGYTDIINLLSQTTTKRSKTH